MGLFNFFKKKVTNDTNDHEHTETNPVDRNLYLVEMLRKRLMDMGHHVEFHTQYLALIINNDLEIATTVIEDPNIHASLLYVRIAAIHSVYFPNGIHENVVGAGLFLQEQVNAAVSNYINSTFLTIMDAFTDTHDPDIDFVKITKGKEILWHPKLGSLNFQGDWQYYPQNEPLYDLLKQLIPEKLTSNKFNWLKIYISKNGDNIVIGDCLFNNQQWEEGLNEISEYAKSWKFEGDFRGLKQFIMFRRCDAYDDQAYAIDQAVS